MCKDLIQLREICADRPPNWRWERAKLLESNSRSVSRSTEDPIVVDIRNYLKDLHKGDSPERLIEKYPLIYEVGRIYEISGNTRWMLEALIMANTSKEVIAERFGYGDYGIQVIEAYEKCIFDVRSRLKADAFILADILGTTINSRIIPTDEKIWKALGWVGFRKNYGTALLDGYINIEDMPEAVKKWYDKFIECQFTRKTLGSLFKFDPINTPELVEVMKVFTDTKRYELDARIKGAATSDSEIEESQRSLLSSLQISVVQISKATDKPNAIEVSKHTTSPQLPPGAEEDIEKTIISAKERQLEKMKDSQNLNTKSEE